MKGIEVVRQTKFIVMHALLLLLSINASAYEVSVEFSADAIQVMPGRSAVYSKMYVSKSAVRTEMLQQGKRIIDITYLKKGKRVLLYPEQKMYMEQTDLNAWIYELPNETHAKGLINYIKQQVRSALKYGIHLLSDYQLKALADSNLVPDKFRNIFKAHQ